MNTTTSTTTADSAITASNTSGITSTTDSTLEPITSRLTDTTLSDLIAVGERMSRDGDHLEKLIWQIKAEAYGQFKAATAKYLEDEKECQGSGSVEAVVAAGNRITELKKLWSQAVALRNRAVHFAASQLDSDESHSSRFPALKEVFDARRPQS